MRPTQPSASSCMARFDRWRANRPFWYYTAPLVAWLAIVAYGSLARSEDLPSALSHWSDKWLHGLSYALIGLLMVRDRLRERAPCFLICLAAACASLAWGVGLEFLQALTSYRTFEWADILANFVGVGAGVAAWLGGLAALRRIGAAPRPLDPSCIPTRKAEE